MPSSKPVVEARPYAGPQDLRLMQGLVQESWRLVGARSERHIGDLAWGTYQHRGREPEWERRLWLDDGALVAYGWLYRPDSRLDWEVHPERPELLDDVLDWFEAEASGDLTSSARADDAHAIETLGRRGYAEVTDEPWLAYMIRDLADLDAPRLPPGFTLRTVSETDVDARVEAHRSAFHPSRVTVESYRNVMRAWPYRAELDCIAVAPDGRVASYVLAWYDEANRVGEFEPVGTHEEFRRLGLARATNLFALARLRDEGALHAIVLCRGDAEYPAAKRLYEAVGFRQQSRSVDVRKPA